MPFFNGLLTFLDSRSFSSIWFWLVLAAVWTLAGRNVLGVPHDVVRRARQGKGRDGGASSDAPEVLALLDWLSLTLPRWRINPAEAVSLIVVVSFGLSSLLLLGFGYGLEMAQALFLLAGPLAGVTLLNLFLARRLRVILAKAQSGQIAAESAAHQAARLMRRHRLVVMAVSIAAVVLCAFWGTLWLALHPFGF